MPSVNEPIVFVGGGHGIERMIHFLLEIRNSLIAILTMFDSGSHTGEIRRKYKVPGWGDVRRLIAAFMDPNTPDVDYMRKFVRHRFMDDNHSFGNDMLLAAWEICDKNLPQAIAMVCHVCGVRPDAVIPVSLYNSDLCARLDDGTWIVGEGKIDSRPWDDKRNITEQKILPTAHMYRPAFDAIQQADKVVFGPGSPRTSIEAALLVEGLPEAIQLNQGKLIAVAPLMSEPNQTRGWVASDYARMITERIGRRLDVIICNNGPITQGVMGSYFGRGAAPILMDTDRLGQYADRVCFGDFVDEEEEVVLERGKLVHKTVVRHNRLVADMIAEL